MANLSPAPKLQFFDANGNPLVGGKLYSYAAGTTTPLATFTDSTEGSSNPNPTFLDSRGEANIWLGAAQYKFKLTTSTDVEIWTVDNIGGGVTLSQLAAPGGAALIGNAPAGTISATTVQGAINEIVSDLAASSGSSLVGFLQAGAGATARTAQAKMRDVVSVKDFGAVGDGVANDTTAIQAALTAANNVYFPSGTYLVSQAVRLTGGKRIYGDGQDRSIIIRSNTTPETINGVSVTAAVYVSSRYNNIEDIGITGDRTGVATTASVDGIYLGNLGETANNSSFSNIRIRDANSCIRAGSDVFMLVFSQINCSSSVAAFNFSSGVFKTSLTFTSCWAENCGQAYDFNLTLYSVLNACGADYANYTSTGNPYGFGFGSRSSSKGVYNFSSSNVTLNSCGAEQSFGDGVFKFQGNCQATLNSPQQDACSSEFVPDYVSYGDVAVGPIQTDVAGFMNTLTINAPRGMSGWTNPAVATGYPTRPISQLLSFNYLEGTYGVRQETAAVVTGAQGLAADLIKGVASSQYCVLIDSLKRNPVIIGTFTQGGVVNQGFTLSGSGTIITIPFVSQGIANRKHVLRLIGRDNTFNGNLTRPFAADIGVASLTSLVNVSSGNLLGISTVTISGLNLIITLSAAVTNPLMFVETLSENISLIDFSNMSIS